MSEIEPKTEEPMSVGDLSALLTEIRDAVQPRLDGAGLNYLVYAAQPMEGGSNGMFINLSDEQRVQLAADLMKGVFISNPNDVLGSYAVFTHMLAQMIHDEGVCLRLEKWHVEPSTTS